MVTMLMSLLDVTMVTSISANMRAVDELMLSTRGLGAFNDQVRQLTSRLLSMPRHALTHTTLTERNWSFVLD